MDFGYQCCHRRQCALLTSAVSKSSSFPLTAGPQNPWGLRPLFCAFLHLGASSQGPLGTALGGLWVMKTGFCLSDSVSMSPLFSKECFTKSQDDLFFPFLTGRTALLCPPTWVSVVTWDISIVASAFSDWPLVAPGFIVTVL